MVEYSRNRKGADEEDEGYFCRFTFGQFFALLVIEIFTVFFVFYLGARYGREILGMEQLAADPLVSESVVEVKPDEPIENKVVTTGDAEAASLVEKAQTPELKEKLKRMIENAQKPKENVALPDIVELNRKEEPQSDGEAQSGANEVIKSGEINDQVIKQQEPIRGDGSVKIVGGEIVPNQGNDVSSDQDVKPPKDEKNNDAGMVRVKSADNAKYSVQVGSYPSVDEAKRIVDRWKSKGYASFMMIADIPDKGRWYRVRLGGFESHDDAKRYLNDFQSKENVEALVVLNEQ